MDPFTDVLRAFADGRVDILALYAWFNEWARMMDPSLVCRGQEMGTQVCANAMETLIRLSW